LTQLGFIRLSSNPAFTSDAVPPSQALAMLESITTVGKHEFWPDEIDCSRQTFAAGARIVGHRQVTDAYLVSLARSRSGCVATLDKRMQQLLPRGEASRDWLRIIGT
jgi:hypothetical protein